MSALLDMTLVSVNVSDLTGAALDWAAVMTKGVQPRVQLGGTYGHPSSKLFVLAYDTPCSMSTNWTVGGPLLEANEICFNPNDCTPLGLTGYVAYSKRNTLRGMTGKTQLEAACRLVVATVFGDTVQVPACLVTTGEQRNG